MKKISCLMMAIIFILPVILTTGCGSDNLNAAGGKRSKSVSSEKFAYETLWQEVQNYSDRGLPRSALAVVEKIYKNAKEKHHAAEFIKALIHKMHFIQGVEEEAFVKIFDLLNEEIKDSRFPITPVLHSMLAEQYWNYYESNRYRFLQRSAAGTEVKNDDIRTWDLRKIVEEVVHRYRESLQDAEKSKSVKISLYDKILYKNETGRKYRPTLYDFLAHRAIDFFKDNEPGLIQPVNTFTLDREEYFAPSRDFAGQTISTSDPLSFLYYTLTGLQELVRFHLSDQIPEALVDVDLKRYRFLYKEGTFTNKGVIFEKALKQMIAAYGEAPVTAEIYYELALLYNEWGDSYKPRDISADTYKWYKKKARRLCEETVKKYPGSVGAANCAYLIDRIEARKLNIKLERVQVPGAPGRALVRYRNIDKIYLLLIKTDREEMEKKRRLNYKDMVKFYTGKEVEKRWQTALPEDGDFQEHAAEIKIEGLKTGDYVLLASDSPEFDFTNRAVAYTYFSVSGIAYIHRSDDKNGLEFHLLHRDSGAPLSSGTAQVWYREYDRNIKDYTFNRGPLFRADSRGYIHIFRQVGLKNYFRLEFGSDDDRLFVDQEFYLATPYNRYPKDTRTFFFTDRAIYRPGQTLHFKGIMLHADSENGAQTRILPGRSTRVVLYDVNNRKISQLDLATNEFGTFSGTFQLPVGGLNGLMHISDGHGSSNFSVEEYKRPKFQVSFAPLQETYKLGDTVTVKGSATAYAGYNIDNAEVRYRVVREVFYPYRWYCWWYTPPTPQMEILNETCKTDAKGEFEISFTAAPDDTVSKNLRPAFNFVIHAEVTDINGETRQAGKRVPIGYTALKIGMHVPEQLDKEKNDRIFHITSTNLSGNFVPAAGTVTFYRLKENGRLIRKRLWDTPDRVTLSKEEYYNFFPHDSIADEDDYRQWQKEKEVFKHSFDTAKIKELQLTGISKWKSGKYTVEILSQDRYGTPVKEILYFTLYSAKEKKVPFTQPDWFTIPKTSVEPGEKAILLFGSSAENVRVIYEVEHRGKIAEKKYLSLSNEQRKIEIPITENHRGNLGVHLTFIKYNRVYRHSETIVVPWSDKNLDITFETFRDKLKPGEKEEWRIRIKPCPGSNGARAGEKFMAEMAATLYDASLDAFRSHNWGFDVFPHHFDQRKWQSNNDFTTVDSRLLGILQKSSSYIQKYYDSLNWFGFYLGRYYHSRELRKGAALPQAAPPPPGEGDEMEFVAAADIKSKKRNGGKDDEGIGAAASYLNTKDYDMPSQTPEPAADLATVKARTNLQETAFFYPHLRTGAEGEIVIAFTIPEALTQWKMLGFAHTKNLEYGLVTNQLVTQKELMVVPNTPRFLREGDSLVLTSKITNLSDRELSGQARLTLFDAVTLQPVDAKFENSRSDQSFTAGKGESARVSWQLHIPDDINTVTYRIVASAGSYSDGEEQPLPVLKNRMLVTETLPLPVRSQQTRDFRFDKLIASARSTTLKHHKLTLEFTANPVWYAVQALPYLMEYPYECLEQVFSRYYANSIASHIVKTNPKIKRVFSAWESAESADALLSNLEKNPELKALLLEETPWVMQAQNETERKKRVALLFDINKMAKQMDRAQQMLKEGQMPSGAWPWFKGMRESSYITRHIVCGFAHLDRLQVINTRRDQKIWAMLREAVPYLDRQIKEDYRHLLRREVDLKSQHIGHSHVHYLYARSYFKDIPMDDSVTQAFAYYKDQAKTYWVNFGIYLQGMIALSLNRYDDPQTAAAILKSLKEFALHSEEMGMYWKSSYGYYWYQSPIETHALLIEAFSEIAADGEAVDELKTWLLKQKQTRDWRTTKATAEACYALLLRGNDWIAESKEPEIIIGKKNPLQVEPQKTDNTGVEAGTGYFKTSWSGTEITPDMGYIRVKNNNKVAAWGGLYWQYFENLDKITPAETPLQLKKELFIEKPSATGPVLKPLLGNAVRVGDRIKVRIELRVDRAMEYVHMKDMRAAAFEPENVISRYKWQDGLGYYESTRDASTNFFFDYLPKGTYVFEYPLRVGFVGDFSNGITTIQCMYAPEFAGHSQGVRVQVK